MNFETTVKEFCSKHQEERIAMFVDMDGVIADLVIDLNRDIINNTPNYFYNKAPMNTIIKKLENVSKIPNLDLFILTACVYKNQADDKKRWLKEYADFFTEDKQIYVIKEVVKYDYQTKPFIKTGKIKETMQQFNYDYAIYVEDELEMLRTAAKLLKNKIICFHISNLID